MRRRIRIIKGGRAKGVNDCAAKPITKSDRQVEREMVDAVKDWVEDWHERKRQLQAAANVLIRSMGVRHERTTQRLAKVH